MTVIEWLLVVRSVQNVPAFRRVIGVVKLFEFEVSERPAGWDAAVWYKDETECREMAALLALAGWKTVVSRHEHERSNELELDE